MFMTQETPAKIFSLLGAAMFSMFLLFAVSATNASFDRTETALPDMFNPSSVMAVLDSISNSYSKFAQANLLPNYVKFRQCYDFFRIKAVTTPRS